MMTERLSDVSLSELRPTIATKIMGLDVEPSAEQLNKYDEQCADFAAAWVIYGSELGAAPHRPTGPDYHKMLAYESDIGAAWKVIDEMRRRGYHPRMRDVGEERSWVFYDHKLGHEREHRWATCDSDAEAICRAALGVEIDD